MILRHNFLGVVLKMKKEFVVTDTMQKVAVDILQELECFMMGRKDTPKEIMDIYNRMFKKYRLCNDPFVGMCCTCKEYAKQSLEYDKQTMIERYGHCDGLE